MRVLKRKNEVLKEIFGSYTSPKHESSQTASKEKEKGVELKDVEEIDRPRPTSTRSLLTLKPLPKIDPKDKGKKKIEEEDESESEDDDIPQAVKKFKQLESDEEMVENSEKEEQFTIAEKRKFLHVQIAAQRKFLARQRSEAIRNRPPTKNQLRNQMMTYLKHTDQRLNKKDSSKGEEIKLESKGEGQGDDKEGQRIQEEKHGTKKKMKSRKEDSTKILLKMTI
ncbi:hypothetical protein Tco_1055185 [Tanacetum coccineum]|uniref:Uncharacterized protein n=1 Tax=Tanacetum coccineum TaxID=301880 RepID=A0ABQ5H197_9ASTR